MAWTTPMTAVAGSFTAAQWNTHIRDNLAVTETGIAAVGADPRWFVATGANTLVMRDFKEAQVDTEQTRTSTTLGDLTTVGPAVTITTGTKVIVMISARVGNDTSTNSSQMTYGVTGASTITEDVKWGVTGAGLQASTAANNTRSLSAATLHTVTAGSNTFTMKYKAEAGTARFSHRRIAVWSF